ncbi:MAG: hypothetical protein VZQ80_00535 [Lachnospiraceae bacterium]|nr:hypothetical protein [Lachnospiraceae bacterium]
MAQVLKDYLNSLSQTKELTIEKIRGEFDARQVDVQAEDGFILFNYREGADTDDEIVRDCCGTILAARGENDGVHSFIVPDSIDYVCRPLFTEKRDGLITVWKTRFKWNISTPDQIHASDAFWAGNEKSVQARFEKACDKLCGVSFPMTGWKRFCVKLDKTLQMSGKNYTFMFRLQEEDIENGTPAGIRHVGTCDKETGEVVYFDFNSYFDFEGGAVLY